MSYGWEFSNTPAGKVLRAIQRRGKASIKDVAADLGVTASAVRLHLTQLEARGAIQAEQVREGVGRPYYVYSVTPQAQGLFCRDQGELTRLLLTEIAQTQGVDALQEILRRVGDRLVAIYQEQVWGQGLADRVRAWAELLAQRGIAVEIEKTSQGYILREYDCPYHSAAVEHRAVCQMEQQVMARLLGTGVKLTHCGLDGNRGCRFTVTEIE